MSVQVGAGNHYSLFFKDGVVYSAGENNEAQLGRGEITATGVAWGDVGEVELPAGFSGEIVAISAGQLHGAFLTAAGEVYTWGDNNLGKLGQGTTTNYESLVPTKVAALDGVAIETIYMANGASYAISRDGVLYSWGQNTNGQLGNGSLTNTGTPMAISASAFGGEAVAAVSSGTSFTLVLTRGGEVYAMGSGVQGQLGNGTAGSGTRSNVPLKVEVPGTVVKVVAGTNTALAITEDGKVWGWGQSDYGQLVKGTIVDGLLTNAVTTNSTTPIEIQGLPDDIVDAHIGSRWGIALTADGEVWAWGRNDEGWLGLETSTGAIETIVAPTKIPGFDGIKIVSIEGGPNHSLAVDEDGNIYGWGNMNQGRLGTEQVAGTWASGPILIPLESDGRKVIVGTTETDVDLNGGTLPTDKSGFSIYGYGGDDTITGSDGSDLLNGGVGNDAIGGGAGDDILLGGAGNDQLDGAEGADTMRGGSGDDTYVVDDAGDMVEELFAHGHDTVYADMSYTLVAQVEDLVLNGEKAIDGTGNALSNSITGNAAANRLDGAEGDDILEGGAGDDELVGGAGDDVAVFDGAMSDYTIRVAADGSAVIVVDNRAGADNDGTDRLVGVETLRFADQSIEAPANVAPTSPSLSGTSVEENKAAGTVVGTVSATDAEGSDLTYELIGPSSTLFRLDGTSLVTTQVLDFETIAADTVTIKVTDEAGLSAVKTFTIDVLDVDEGPSAPALSNLTVKEGLAAGTVVGALSATDPEGGALTYKLVGPASGFFQVVGKNLVTTTVLDFETLASDRVTVAVTDASGHSATQTFTISIGNVDEAPSAPVLSNSAVKEGVAIGTVVGELTSVDPEGAAIVYTLADSANGLFALDGNRILTAALLDYDVVKSGTIVVQASDGNNTVRQSFSIGVEDVIEEVPGTTDDDRILGSDRSDVLRGGAGDDRLSGGAGDDRLFGGEGDDSLGGGLGDDRLIGGPGQDQLRGGRGADTFVFRSLADLGTTEATADVVLDFSRKENDIIDLSAIDANTGRTGNQSFTFIGNEGFSSTVGELRFDRADGRTRVSGDVDGDGDADFMIVVSGRVRFEAADFAL